MSEFYGRRRRCIQQLRHNCCLHLLVRRGQRHADITARALKAKGATWVMMAGRPGVKEASLRAAGVDQFLFAGTDAVAILKELHEKFDG